MANVPVQTTTTTTEPHVVSDTTGKGAGTTTIGATGGASLAGAVAIVIAYIFQAFGIDLPGEVQSALVVIIAAVGAYVGGRLTPTDRAKTIEVRTTETTQVQVPVPQAPALGPVTQDGVPNYAAVPGPTSEVVPSGSTTARHRADVPAV